MGVHTSGYLSVSYIDGVRRGASTGAWRTASAERVVDDDGAMAPTDEEGATTKVVALGATTTIEVGCTRARDAAVVVDAMMRRVMR